MKYRLRRTVRLFGGLARLNFTQRGFSSWSVGIPGLWSWNSRTRKHKVNTPGPGYVETSGRKRRT